MSVKVGWKRRAGEKDKKEKLESKRSQTLELKYFSPSAGTGRLHTVLVHNRGEDGEGMMGGSAPPSQQWSERPSPWLLMELWSRPGALS